MDITARDRHKITGVNHTAVLYAFYIITKLCYLLFKYRFKSEVAGCYKGNSFFQSFLPFRPFHLSKGERQVYHPRLSHMYVFNGYYSHPTTPGNASGSNTDTLSDYFSRRAFSSAVFSS